MSLLLFLCKKGGKEMKDAQIITVGLPGRRYHIAVGNGILDTLGTLVAAHRESPGQVVVVSDENVWAAHEEDLTTAMEKADIPFVPVIRPPGEGNKSIEGLARLYDAFAQMKLRRSGMVVAFGGGVIGDLAGFAAATYMRGVSYIQVPTTLLSQVDSSVGGKTGINLPSGKNMAGAFYQPRAVLIDTATLRTLPPREWRCGMAEVIKYGAIRSEDLFQRLYRLEEMGDCRDIILRCCGIKSEVVAMDEHDNGERMLLNFGHTFGHGVEKRYEYSRYNHGEGVAVGMRIAAAVGEELGLTEKGTARRLVQLMERHGLDAACPFPLEELIPLMELDKKSGGGGVRLVLLERIGKAFTKTIPFAELRVLLEGLEEKWKRRE